MGENQGLHCCLRSAFLPALCWSWYVSSLSSATFLRTLLKKLRLPLQKMKCLPLLQIKKGGGRKHISPQTFPSSSYMVSDSHLTEICSTPSILRSSLYTRKGIWPKLLVNMKQDNGIVTAFQHELIFLSWGIDLFISASLKRRSTTMSWLYHLVYGLYVAQSSARNLNVILLPGITFCLWCTNYRGVTEHLFPIINQGRYPGTKFCLSHERMYQYEMFSWDHILILLTLMRMLLLSSFWGPHNERQRCYNTCFYFFF